MKLKDYLQQNDVSITDLQKATDIPYATLLAYIHGKHSPNLKNALKINKATLGAVKLEDMIDEEEG